MIYARNDSLAMDFFEHQERARRKTGVLVGSLAVTVILLVTALYFVSLHPYLAHLQKAGMLEGVPMNARILWQPSLLAVVSAVVLTAIGLAMLYKIFRLRKGGAAVAELLGAKRIDPRTSRGDERRLVNVVEEMSIAAGTPVPPVYVVEMPSINAFAAGWNPANAVIVVTRGSLDYLSRDELQAVIAHELSHVLHGDTGLNIRLLGLLHGIMFIGLTGLTLIKSIRHFSFEGEEAGKVGCALSMPFLLVGIPLAIIGYTGVLAARVTKSAIAREREYLADAAAAQFTRNPDALVSALRKIGGHEAGSRIFHSRAEELSHFFFSEGARSLVLRPSWFRGWLRSHPSLSERITRIDADFDGTFLNPTPTAGSIAPRVGAPTSKSWERGRELLREIPDSLRRAVHDPGESILLLYAVLVPVESTAHFGVLERFLSPDGVRATRDYHQAMAPLSQDHRLVLVDLCAPVLRELDDETRKTVLARLAALADADSRLDAFEQAMYAVIRRRLDDAGNGSRAGSRARSAELAIVLSTLARAGHSAEDEATAAYHLAVRRLPAGIAMPDRPLLPEDLGSQRLAEALARLAELSPWKRKGVLDACVHAVLSDRNVNASEAALIRTVAGALDCPLPPLSLESRDPV